MKSKSLIKLFSILSSVGFALCCIGGIVVGTFTNASVTNVSEYRDKNEFYSKKGFDLIVKGPSDSQIEGFKVREDITQCIPFLEIDLNTTINGNNNQSTFLIFDNVIDLKYTENTDVRLIKSKEGLANPVFVDYKFAKNNNLNINDSFTVVINGNPKECLVSRIYRTDFIFSKGVIIATTDIIPTSFKSGVYLSTNNIDSLMNDLKEYKPMGTLLEKTEYQTDEQYQQYLESFYAKDYSKTHVLDYKEDEKANETTNLPKAESSKVSLLIASIVFGVIVLSLSLAGFIIVGKNKKDFIYKYIHDNGSIKPIKGYSVFNGIMVLTVIASSLISAAIASNNASSYISFGNALALNIWTILIPAIGIVIGYLFTLFKLKKA